MTTRKRRAIILTAVAIPVAAVAWWLGSPRILDRTANEAFPRTATAAIPDSMTREEVEQVMSDMAKLETEAGEPMPDLGAPTPAVLKRGQFEAADNFHRGRGRATIYRLADGQRVLRFEDFRVTNGPDLRVLLSQHAGPTTSSVLSAAGYVELGKLKGNIGNQNYPIPDGLAIEDQLSVVIYCRPFHVVFSVARLEVGSQR